MGGGGPLGPRRSLIAGRSPSLPILADGFGSFSMASAGLVIGMLIGFLIRFRVWGGVDLGALTVQPSLDWRPRYQP